MAFIHCFESMIAIKRVMCKRWLLDGIMWNNAYSDDKHSVFAIVNE